MADAPSLEHQPAPRRVLAIFAHPDDESWAAGGLLTRWAHAGAAIHLVTLTRGERGFDRLSRRHGQALAVVREQELARACERLGLGSFEILGLPDLGVSEPETAARLAPILQRTAPEVIVGFDRDGGYGHIDHVNAVSGTLAALRAHARPLTIYAAAFAPGLLEPLRARLARAHPHLLHATYRTRRLDQPCLAADTHPLRLDLSAAEATAKREALMAHASQLGRAGPDAFLGPGVFDALATVEQYRVLPPA
jgi:LmbE family N-acetylglucosaminyl deacetylase